jgi:cystathionine beta-lyase/cystathionine gamma-synthase
MECNGVLYGGGQVYPGYEVGQMQCDDFRSLFSFEKPPSGFTVMEEMDLTKQAKKFGDPNSTKAYSLTNLKTKWYFDSLKETQE